MAAEIGFTLNTYGGLRMMKPFNMNNGSKVRILNANFGIIVQQPSRRYCLERIYKLFEIYFETLLK
jgi:hypothetical protein